MLDPNGRKKLAENAYKALDRISWKKMESRYLTFIDSVLGTRNTENILVYPGPIES